MKKIISVISIVFLLCAVLFGCSFFSAEDVVFSDASFVYDGEEKVLVSKTEVPEGYEIRYENNKATEVGKYLCRASVWNLKKGELECEKFAILEILPAEYDMRGIEFESLEVDYDGKPHTLAISANLPEGVSVSYTQNTYTDAGVYEVVASFSGDKENFAPIEDMRATLKINPIPAPVSITVEKGVLHTGSSPSFKTDIEGEVTLREGQTLVPGTNTYYCDFTPKSENYLKKENIPITLSVMASVFYYNGDKLLHTEYINYGEVISGYSVTPYEDGDDLYSFKYWKDKDGARYDGDEKVTKDITLYAEFEKEEKLYVSLVYNESKTEEFGFYPSLLPIKLPIPSGNFLGWHRDRFFSSLAYYSLSDESEAGKEYFALFSPSVTLSDDERKEHTDYETKSVTVTKSEIYRGALVEVNEALPSRIKETDLSKIYGNVENAKLSSSSLMLSEEATRALELLCAEYAKIDSAGNFLVTKTYSSDGDGKSGQTVTLKYMKSSSVSDISAITSAHEFLSAKHADFGFIERYKEEYEYYTGVFSEGKENVYRYVGVGHAVFMERHGLSLEEYLCYVKNYTDEHLFVLVGNMEYEIYYVPCKSDSVNIKVPKNETYTISGNNNDGFIVTVERRAYARDLGILVCVDAGHGGSDPGANGGESIINLAVAQLVREECEKQGFSVLMTRDADYFVTLQKRCEIANNAKADIFVSIHCNSAESTQASGTEVFYYSGTKSIALANNVYNYMTEMMPLTKRGVKYKDLYVTRYTNMPAILCELAFLSNKSDYAKLHDKECQALWAEAICRGICEYYGVDYIED